MRERIDRALELVRDGVDAAQRIAAALERIAAAAERQAFATRPPTPPRAPSKVSDADREAAKRTARRMGLVVREGR